MKGQCLCGAVHYEIEPPQKVFQYCHCSRCRKITGSAFAALMFVRPEQFRWIQGEQHVKRFEHPEARFYATCFCDICGSNLPWAAKTGGAIMVPAGTLNDDPQLRPQQNIHFASHADWFVDPAELPSWDELPPRKPKPAETQG